MNWKIRLLVVVIRLLHRHFFQEKKPLQPQTWSCKACVFTWTIHAHQRLSELCWKVNTRWHNAPYWTYYLWCGRTVFYLDTFDLPQNSQPNPKVKKNLKRGYKKPPKTIKAKCRVWRWFKPLQVDLHQKDRGLENYLTNLFFVKWKWDHPIRDKCWVTWPFWGEEKQK